MEDITLGSLACEVFDKHGNTKEAVEMLTKQYSENQSLMDMLARDEARERLSTLGYNAHIDKLEEEEIREKFGEQKDEVDLIDIL